MQSRQKEREKFGWCPGTTSRCRDGAGEAGRAKTGAAGDAPPPPAAHACAENPLRAPGTARPARPARPAALPANRRAVWRRRGEVGGRGSQLVWGGRKR